MHDGLALGSLFLALLGGIMRVSTPFLFVSLGECITEISGRINLGLEGTLVFGAMSGYGVSWLTGSPWLGVLAAGVSGMLLGLIHGLLCSLPKVNDIAVGIAMMLFGTGISFFIGKPLIQPEAAMLPSWHLGAWSHDPQVRDALRVNALLPLGMGLSVLLRWAFGHTRWGLVLRLVGDNATAARALGYHVIRLRILATVAGGFLAGIGGAFLSLYYPGGWNEGLSSGQGLMAVALVIFARWDPVRCALAALLFGAAGALGPALQSQGVTQGYYLFNAAPYVLTLILMTFSWRPGQTLAGSPGELSLTNRS